MIVLNVLGPAIWIDGFANLDFSKYYRPLGSWSALMIMMMMMLMTIDNDDDHNLCKQSGRVMTIFNIGHADRCIWHPGWMMILNDDGGDADAFDKQGLRS